MPYKPAHYENMDVMNRTKQKSTLHGELFQVMKVNMRNSRKEDNTRIEKFKYVRIGCEEKEDGKKFKGTITQNENGKIVLIGKEEQKEKTYKSMHYSLLPRSSEVIQEEAIPSNHDDEDCKDHNGNLIRRALRLSAKTKSRLSNEECKEEVVIEEIPQFRRGRRGAIAETSVKDRQDILNTLRARSVAKSLAKTGLL